jgi:hypothetical protein
MLFSYYSMTSGSNVFINEGIFEQLISSDHNKLRLNSVQAEQSWANVDRP